MFPTGFWYLVFAIILHENPHTMQIKKIEKGSGDSVPKTIGLRFGSRIGPAC